MTACGRRWTAQRRWAADASIVRPMSPTAPRGARGLAIEWSAWTGRGMGERLGTIERLADRGVTALSVDDALDEFERLVRDDAEGTISVCGRFGASCHASAEAASLPALRFVGQPLVFYPGTE